jgi:hypothetical protein
MIAVASASHIDSERGLPYAALAAAEGSIA